MTEDLDKKLLGIGFSFKGEFDPIEFDADSFKVCEIGSWIVGIQPQYMALLNYSDMEYWDVANGDISIALQAISIISKYEINRKAGGN